MPSGCTAPAQIGALPMTSSVLTAATSILSRRSAITRLAGITLFGVASNSLCATASAQTALDQDLAAKLAAAVPSGTNIAVADQDDAVSVPWQLSGVDKGAPYKATIANFAGGTAILEALISSAVDIGYVGEAPLPIAVGQGVNDLVAIAANAN